MSVEMSVFYIKTYCFSPRAWHWFAETVKVTLGCIDGSGMVFIVTYIYGIIKT